MKKYFVFLLVFLAFNISADEKIVENYEDGKEKIVYSVDRNGLKSGRYQEFYPSGKLKIKANYKKGKLHGKYNLYFESGKNIFPKKIPSSFTLEAVRQLFFRGKMNRKSAAALTRALEELFGDENIAQIYSRRGIALSIPAVDMSTYRSWLFKTAHLDGKRDDPIKISDVCLAASAAPVFRSMARIHYPTTNHYNVFVDGGLWANNPVLIGLIDAIRMTKKNDEIEIFSMGTCSPPGGEIISKEHVDRGIMGWKLGGEATSLSITAQESAFDYMANFFADKIPRNCNVMRFPSVSPSRQVLDYLDIDETSEKAFAALEIQANADVNHTLKETKGEYVSEIGRRINDLFNDMPQTIG